MFSTTKYLTESNQPVGYEYHVKGGEFEKTRDIVLLRVFKNLTVIINSLAGLRSLVPKHRRDFWQKEMVGDRVFGFFVGHHST